MNPARVWKILAFAQPAFCAVLWSFVSVRIRLVSWCQMGLAHLAYRTVLAFILLCVIFAVSIALMFMVHALRNARLSWGMRLWWTTALLLFSPLLVPAYWLLHLRRA